MILIYALFLLHIFKLSGDPVGFSCQGPCFTMKYCFKPIVFTYCHGSKTCVLMTAPFPNLRKSGNTLDCSYYEWMEYLFLLVDGPSRLAHKNSPKVHPEPLMGTKQLQALIWPWPLASRTSFYTSWQLACKSSQLWQELMLPGAAHLQYQI